MSTTRHSKLATFYALPPTARQMNSHIKKSAKLLKVIAALDGKTMQIRSATGKIRRAVPGATVVVGSLFPSIYVRTGRGSWTVLNFDEVEATP